MSNNVDLCTREGNKEKRGSPVVWQPATNVLSLVFTVAPRDDPIGISAAGAAAGNVGGPPEQHLPGSLRGCLPPSLIPRFTSLSILAFLLAFVPRLLTVSGDRISP